MPNYKVRSEGKVQVIETYKAASAEGSKTFSFPDISMDDVSKLILTLDGSTTGTLILKLTVNADTTSSYYSDGRNIAAGTETLINIDAAAYMQLFSAVGSDAFAGTIEFQIVTAHATDQVFMNVVLHSPGGNDTQWHGLLLTANTVISSIEITTSTSTWKAGTRFTLYKLLR